MKCKIYIVILICVALALCAVLAACHHSQPTEEGPAMSEVRLQDHVLSWDPVEGALYYSLRVCFDEHNGYEIPVEGTSYVLKFLREGTYTLYLRPVLESGFGAYSPAIRYVVADETITPTDKEGVSLRGAGTYEDPLLIYTREELETLTDGKRTEDVDGEPVEKQNYYRLMMDIDLSDATWTPLALDSGFGGVLDGNGHTIKGLHQTELGARSSKRGGLFANLIGATIVNLTLEGVNIDIGPVTDEFRVGGLAGNTSGNTVIENCSVSGSIKVNSAQTTTRKGYVGMLVGYAGTTDVQRVRTDGKVDVTFAGVYAGGVGGFFALQSSLDNVLSTVDVYAYGTGRSGGTAAGRAYAAGIGYLSGVDSVAHCVWLGKASTKVTVGTPAGEEMYASGMFVGGGTYINKDGSFRILLRDCFFDIDGIDYDREAYPRSAYATESEWLAALADRYAVGNATKQLKGTARGTSTVYAVNASNKNVPSAYHWTEDGVEAGLDWEDVWQIADGRLSLRPYRSEWCEVRFLLADGSVASLQHILRGRTANPPTVVGEDGVALKWDFNSSTPITQDITIYTK